MLKSRLSVAVSVRNEQVAFSGYNGKTNTDLLNNQGTGYIA
jgi:hypothetical protein